MQVAQSAGLAITNGPKILLVHPTGARWQGTFSIPKGLIVPGETPLEAAIRETREEVGITVFPAACAPGGIVDYTDARGRLTKQVHWFAVDLGALDPPDRLPDAWLQRDEVDWAGFLGRAEAETKIFWRFRPILDRLL